MTKKLGNPFKNTKLKAFFFFLLMATAFWILTKFSRQYTATVTNSIKYINLPEKTFITGENLKNVTFDLTSSGFDFLIYKLKNPNIEIDVNRHYLPSEKKAVIPNNELIRLISDNLNANMMLRNLAIKDLIVKLDDIVLKKVPVILKTDFTYKVGFRPIDSIVVIPDSIVVSGPSVYLETIHFVETAVVLGKDLDKTLSIPVAVVHNNSKNVSFTPSEVVVSVPIAEFSQKEMVLPIEIINVPFEITVKLIPNVITIKFNVSIEDFKDINESDFKLICDYAERNIQENSMIPKLVKIPRGIIDVEYSARKIDYLIFK